MLCDSCGAQVRPVFVSDIDGTIGDYHAHFLSFAESYWHRGLSHGWDGSGNWEDYLGLTQPEYRQAKLAYRQGGMKRNLPLHNGANQFMNYWSTADVDLWLATTRPWQRLDNIDPDTQFWVHSHKWEVKGLLYGEDKFYQIVQAVDKERIIAVVDDLAENLEVADGLGLPTFQVEREHNRGYGLKWDRRGTLAQATTWAAQRLQEWQEENE